MSKRIALYYRVSTDEQTTDPQRLELHDYCAWPKRPHKKTPMIAPLLYLCVLFLIFCVINQYTKDDVLTVIVIFIGLFFLFLITG